MALTPLLFLSDWDNLQFETGQATGAETGEGSWEGGGAGINLVFFETGSSSSSSDFLFLSFRGAGGGGGGGRVCGVLGGQAVRKVFLCRGRGASPTLVFLETRGSSSSSAFLFFCFAACAIGSSGGSAAGAHRRESVAAAASSFCQQLASDERF